MVYRSRTEKQTYLRHLAAHRNDPCPFCNPVPEQTVKQAKHFYVIENIFPYSFWDWHRVTDHLMIVPRKHVEAIGRLSDAAKIEFVGLVDEFEGKGYNIYSRTPGSPVKSVPHQHTHCIKTDNRTVTLLAMLTKPYIRFLR